MAARLLNEAKEFVTGTSLYDYKAHRMTACRIDGNQDVPAGSYADTVVATVNF